MKGEKEEEFHEGESGEGGMRGSLGEGPARATAVRSAWCPPLLSSRKIFSSIFFSVVLAAASAAAQGPPLQIVLERIVDARGNRVCDVAKATLRAEGAQRSAWVVRGLVRDDLVLTLEVVGGQAALHTISLAGRPPLRFSSPTPGGRVTAVSPVSTFRYFDVDLSRKTVRCNLSRLAEETAADLLPAAAEYGLLKQGLESGAAYAPEESPVVALLAVLKQRAHPSPPYRKTVPLSEKGAETDDLAAAAASALGR